MAVGPPSAWSHSAIAAAAPSAPRICSAAASVSIGAGGSTPQVELECQAAGARLAGHAAGQPAGCPQLAHRPRAGWCSPAINGNFSIPNNAGTAVLPLDITWESAKAKVYGRVHSVPLLPKRPMGLRT